MTSTSSEPPDPVVRHVLERLRSGDLQHDIAADLGVNQGRISEINTGKLRRLQPRKRPYRPDQPKFI